MSDQTLSRAPTTRNTNAPTPTSDNDLVWSDMRLLGFTPMDDIYEEFHMPTLKPITCLDAGAADVIGQFEQHVISHFEQEDEQICSINPPPRGCRLVEHAAVPKSVGDVRQAVALGEAGADVARGLRMALFD